MQLANNGEVIENPSGDNHQLITSSLDGYILLWDMKYKKEMKGLDLSWRPFLKVAKSQGSIYTISSSQGQGPH
jgi:WD40 repeat protein